MDMSSKSNVRFYSANKLLAYPINAEFSCQEKLADITKRCVSAHKCAPRLHERWPEIQEKEIEIKKLLPDAEREKKAFPGAKDVGRSRNEINRTLRELYQAEAERICGQNPKLSDSQVAKSLAPKINALINLGIFPSSPVICPFVFCKEVSCTT